MDSRPRMNTLDKDVEHFQYLRDLYLKHSFAFKKGSLDSGYSCISLIKMMYSVLLVNYATKDRTVEYLTKVDTLKENFLKYAQGKMTLRDEGIIGQGTDSLDKDIFSPNFKGLLLTFEDLDLEFNLIKKECGL